MLWYVFIQTRKGQQIGRLRKFPTLEKAEEERNIVNLTQYEISEIAVMEE